MQHSEQSVVFEMQVSIMFMWGGGGYIQKKTPSLTSVECQFMKVF